MAMNLFDLVKPEPEKSSNGIDRIVFKNTLESFGLDEETINDCLAEPQTSWEFFLNYFGAKQNDK